MTEKPLSGSQTIAGWSSQSDVGSHFTQKSLLEAMASMGFIVSAGAASGFLYTLKKEGVISEGLFRDEEGGRMQSRYTLLTNTMPKTRTRGPSVGNKSGGGPTNRERMVNALLGVAQEIEHACRNLEDYTTEELLKELTRRNRS